MILDKVKSTQIIQRLLTIAIAIFLSFAFALSTQAATFTVTKIADTDDGICDSDCSLREAIDEANTAVTDDIIEFASPLFDTAQTITLGGTQLLIDNTPGNGGSLTINGTGAKLLTIDGNNQSTVFRTSFVNLTINDLTITQGSGSNGGGINFLGEQLTINRSAIVNNFATFDGGGLSLGGNGSSANINDSVISENTTSASGGGLSVGARFILTLVNTTISLNQANGSPSGGDGGGILSAANTTIINCTIASNTARRNGGGIRRVLQSESLLNTIVADNSATTTARNDISGTVNSQGYNLIENTTGATINGTTTGNITGQDPMLFPLDDNGGPTQTHSPSFSSPSIDKGSAATIPFAPFGNSNSKSFDSKSNSNLANLMMPIATDQRGIMRPQDVFFIANPPGGDGSDIGAF